MTDPEILMIFCTNFTFKHYNATATSMKTFNIKWPFDRMSVVSVRGQIDCCHFVAYNFPISLQHLLCVMYKSQSMHNIQLKDF